MEKSDQSLDHHIRKRSVKIAGHNTSLSLEESFWVALSEEARMRGLSINALVEEIDNGRKGNLSSAVRVYLLERAKARCISEN
ncbi:MAG: ribbon-helix-helix domain-containing protein [Kiloniellales bacterium]|nr:ribbon-helix-helix domain-containing protein [Kiloniellales bacterium]